MIKDELAELYRAGELHSCQIIRTEDQGGRGWCMRVRLQSGAYTMLAGTKTRTARWYRQLQGIGEMAERIGFEKYEVLTTDQAINDGMAGASFIEFPLRSRGAETQKSIFETLESKNPKRESDNSTS